jgi:aminoglycoside phosphotransferase family enzyme/predicted kinase
MNRAEVRETHSAVVLLTGDRVYKIKKPVDLGFLDFRSDESRRRVCRRELELNRRLAPDVYLDVITVAGAERHEYEHGIAMRRMPDELRLSTMIRCGADVDDHLRALARLIAGFHAAADRGPQIAAEGSSIGLRRRWSDNLRETEVFRGDTLAEPLHDEISLQALRYIDGRNPLLDERAAVGLSVDGHGDLIAEDIFCLPDHPRVLDCIEFDDRLRWLDVLDDVAFLAMDLEHLQRPELAERFLDWYLEFSGSVAVDSLQHHYVAYRAFVRAKVSCIQARQGLTSAAAEADSYARQALRHLQLGEVTMVLVGGAPGSGKTTLARGIADRRGSVLLSSDEVRREMPLDAEYRYRADAKEATYRELLRRARRLLEHGESVVADATWGEPAMRALASDVATATSSRVVAIECRAPVELAVARAQRRLAAGRDASEAGGDIARRLAEQRAPWPGALTIETDANVEQSLRHALAALTVTQETSARLPE